MSNFVTRTLSGSVYVAVVVATICFVNSCSWAYALVFSAVTAWCIVEYHKLVCSSRYTLVSSTILGVSIFIGSWAGALNHEYLAIAAAIYGLLLSIALILQLFLEADNPIKEWGDMLTGQIFYALPFSLSWWIIGYDWHYLLALYIFIWINDTGAYCTGSLIGRHKMFPRVSPGKSWEGLAGGAFFALLSGVALYFAFSATPTATNATRIIFWLCLALLSVVFGTLGDLMESLLKRSVGVKDSGKFLPGHGGALDRFDSILLTMPIALVFIVLFYSLNGI